MRRADLGPRLKEQVDFLLRGESAHVHGQRSLGQAVPSADLGRSRPTRGIEAVQIDPESDPHDPLDAGPLELAGDEIRRRQRRPHEPAQPANVAPGELGRGPPRPARGLGPGRDDARKVAVVEPDRRHVHPLGGQVDQPGREPGTAHLDQVRPLVRDDAAGGSGGEHEAVGLLRGDGGTVKPIAADAARLEDLVACAGNDHGLPESRPALDVARLLQQVGADPAGGLAEELGDVEDAEPGGGAKPGGQVDHAGDVHRRRPGHRAGSPASRPPPLSQSSPQRIDRAAVGTGILAARRRGPGPRTRSGCRSARSGRRHAEARLAVLPSPLPSRVTPGTLPVRNGLVSRSTPMVVSGPCPLWTTVESGRERNCDWSVVMSVAKSPPGRSVRPIEPLKSTSPPKTMPSPTKLTLPGEWPGVNRTSNSTAAHPAPGFPAEARHRAEERAPAACPPRRRTAAGHRTADDPAGGDGSARRWRAAPRPRP